MRISVKYSLQIGNVTCKFIFHKKCVEFQLLNTKYIPELSVISLYGYCKYKNNLFSFRCSCLGAYSQMKMTQYRVKNYIVFHITGAQFVRPSEHIVIDAVS